MSIPEILYTGIHNSNSDDDFVSLRVSFNDSNEGPPSFDIYATGLTLITPEHTTIELEPFLPNGFYALSDILDNDSTSNEMSESSNIGSLVGITRRLQMIWMWMTSAIR